MVYMYVQRCENSRGSLLLVLRRPRSSEEEEWQDLIEKHFCFCLGLGVCTLYTFKRSLLHSSSIDCQTVREAFGVYDLLLFF